MALAVLIDFGSISLISQHATAASSLDAPGAGRGIPTLALLDLLLLFAVLMMGVDLIMPERIQGRLQGLISLIFSVLLLLACIVTIWGEINLLILMVSLLFAAPFGTLIYFSTWSAFNTDAARIALSLIMFMKLLFAGCLVLSHPRFLQNKGLVLIIITSLAGNLVLAFLHSFVPGFLVSITDDIGAIVVCILAIIWGVIYLIGGIGSVVKAVV
jgi:hypothetical protein